MSESRSELELESTLKTEEVEKFIKKVRDLENQLLDLLKESSKITDGRWASIAKTHFQEGRMAAVRSVTEK